MTTDKPTTEVDLDQVQAAKLWLEQARGQVRAAIDSLHGVPGKIGNAPFNANDNNSAKPGQTPTPLISSAPGGAPAGLLDQVGPTHFGLFPNGLDVAKRHATAYNATLTNLNNVLKNLDDMLAATDYIVANYKKVEAGTLANFQQVLTDPPYDPSADPPAHPVSSGHTMMAV